MHAGRAERVMIAAPSSVRRRDRRMRAQRGEQLGEPRAFDDRDLVQVDVAGDELREQASAASFPAAS